MRDDDALDALMQNEMFLSSLSVCCVWEGQQQGEARQGNRILSSTVHLLHYNGLLFGKKAEFSNLNFPQRNTLYTVQYI